MHQLLHGIRRAFLAACGGSPFGCLPALALLEEHAETKNLRHEGDNGDLLPLIRGQLDDEKKGDLLPLNGDDDQQECVDLAEADNCDLQPYQEGHKNGDSLPQLKGDDADAECNLQREEDADNDDLQPTQEGHDHGGEEEGKILPTSTAEINQQASSDWQHEEGVLSPTIGEDEGATLSQEADNSSQINGMHVSNFDYPLKIYELTNLHATIRKPPNPCMVHDDLFIVHAKPRVDPKVKKKTSLLLCLTIHMPFHPGEYGHDGTPPTYTHHEPYSYLCLNIESFYPPSVPYPQAPSSLALSIQASLSSKEDVDEVLQAAYPSICLPFTPLRGRKGYQARELQDEVKTKSRPGLKIKMKTKAFMMLIIQATLDQS